MLILKAELKNWLSLKNIRWILKIKSQNNLSMSQSHHMWFDLFKNLKIVCNKSKLISDCFNWFNVWKKEIDKVLNYNNWKRFCNDDNIFSNILIF